MATYTVESQFLTYAWNPKIISLRVDPAGLTMNTGDVQQFTATAVWSDGTETDLTTDPNTHWYSDNYWPAPGSDTMSMSNDPGTMGQGTAMGVSTPGYVNATYQYNLFGEQLNGSVTVNIILSGPVVISGLDSLQISGSSTFNLDNWPAGAFGTPAYLEAYPLRRDTSTVPWTSYTTASGTNPNPPRTGYGTFNYNAGSKAITVNDTTHATRPWQGTYTDSPWGGDRYAMNNGSPYQWLTNGYAGGTYTGSGSGSVTWVSTNTPSYIWPYDNPLSAWQIIDNNSYGASANINYYAQTLLQDSNDTFANYGVDQNFGFPRIIHFIGFGPEFVYNFTLVTSIYLHTNMDVVNKWGAEPLPFKAISANEILLWLPSGFSYPQYYPDGTGGTTNWQGMNFEFDDSLGNWYTLNSTFNVFTGV